MKRFRPELWELRTKFREDNPSFTPEEILRLKKAVQVIIEELEYLTSGQSDYFQTAYDLKNIGYYIPIPEVIKPLKEYAEKTYSEPFGGTSSMARIAEIASSISNTTDTSPLVGALTKRLKELNYQTSHHIPVALSLAKQRHNADIGEACEFILQELINGNEDALVPAKVLSKVYDFSSAIPFYGKFYGERGWRKGDAFLEFIMKFHPDQLPDGLLIKLSEGSWGYRDEKVCTFFLKRTKSTPEHSYEFILSRIFAKEYSRAIPYFPFVDDLIGKFGKDFMIAELIPRIVAYSNLDLRIVENVLPKLIDFSSKEEVIRAYKIISKSKPKNLEKIRNFLLLNYYTYGVDDHYKYPVNRGFSSFLSFSQDLIPSFSFEDLLEESHFRKLFEKGIQKVIEQGDLDSIKNMLDCNPLGFCFDLIHDAFDSLIKKYARKKDIRMLCYFLDIEPEKAEKAILKILNNPSNNIDFSNGLNILIQLNLKGELRQKVLEQLLENPQSFVDDFPQGMYKEIHDSEIALKAFEILVNSQNAEKIQEFAESFLKRSNLTQESLKEFERIVAKLDDSDQKQRITLEYASFLRRYLDLRKRKISFKLGKVFDTGRIPRPKRKSRKGPKTTFRAVTRA